MCVNIWYLFLSFWLTSLCMTESRSIPVTTKWPLLHSSAIGQPFELRRWSGPTQEELAGPQRNRYLVGKSKFLHLHPKSRCQGGTEGKKGYSRSHGWGRARFPKRMIWIMVYKVSEWEVTFMTVVSFLPGLPFIHLLPQRGMLRQIQHGQFHKWRHLKQQNPKHHVQNTFWRLQTTSKCTYGHHNTRKRKRLWSWLCR